MRFDELIEKRESILAIAARYDAGNVRVFGSIDLLRLPVDVASEDQLHWVIRDRVLREAIPL